MVGMNLHSKQVYNELKAMNLTENIHKSSILKAANKTFCFGFIYQTSGLFFIVSLFFLHHKKCVAMASIHNFKLRILRSLLHMSAGAYFFTILNRIFSKCCRGAITSYKVVCI